MIARARTVVWVALVTLGAGLGVATGPGVGISTDASLAGTGSAGAPLAISGAGAATSGQRLTSGGGSVAWSPLVVASDGTTVTGTGSAGSPLSVPTTTFGAIEAVGYFGFGSDGACVFDGTTVVAGITPSSNVYTFGRDVLCTSATVSSGVRVYLANWRLFVQDTLTNNGTIDNRGADATSGSGAPGISSGFYANNRNGTGTGFPSGTNGNGTVDAPTWVPAVAASAQAGPGQNGRDGTSFGMGGGGGGGKLGINGCTGGSANAVTPKVVSTGGPSWFSVLRGYGDQDSAVSWMAGGGAGGGCCTSPGPGGGGGASGGVAFIAARIIAGTGVFSARGGNGFACTACTASCTGGGGGGGGAGGVLIVIYNTRSGSTTFSVVGGTGGAGIGVDGGRGGNGADGILMLFNLSGDGT